MSEQMTKEERAELDELFAEGLDGCALVHRQTVRKLLAERNAVSRELDAWKKAVEDDATPACFNCGAPCKACGELEAAQQRIAELQQDADDAHRQLEGFASDAEKYREKIAELTGSDFGATPEDCYRAGFRAAAAEAEQRGFERCKEEARSAARAALLGWSAQDDGRDVFAVVDEAIRQLAKPPEQPCPHPENKQYRDGDGEWHCETCEPVEKA